MKIEENEVYTTKEVAEILKVSMPTIKRMLRDQKLPSTRIGRQHRFLGSDILAILSARKAGSISPEPAAAQQIIYVQVPGADGSKGDAPPQAVVEKQVAAALAAAAKSPPHPRFGFVESPAPPPEQSEESGTQQQAIIDETDKYGEPPIPEEPAEPGVTPASLLPSYESSLSTAERRQRTYMLGKTLLRDIFDAEGNLLFEQGCVVTDLMIETARRKHKFMELFAGLQHED